MCGCLLLTTVGLVAAGCSTAEPGAASVIQDADAAAMSDVAAADAPVDATPTPDAEPDATAADVVDVSETDDGSPDASSDGGAGGADAAPNSDAAAADADAEVDSSTAPCPDTCAVDFPAVPECQQAVWDPVKCVCTLVPAPDAPCEDGDSCSVGDMCVEGECASGPPADPEACQQGITSIKAMPNTSTVLDFDTCSGCACCEGTIYPSNGINACVDCVVGNDLAAYGILKSGGQGSSMVSCITGNDDAPMRHAVIFVGSSNTGGPGEYLVEFEFPNGIGTFGFSGVPSSSLSAPTVELEGYNAFGLLVGYDSHDFAGFVGGSCDTTNPAVQFFGFRACCGVMTKVIARFSDPNVTLDEIRFH